MPPRKPHGEFAWVMDGKTEYHGQLVEPMGECKDRGEDEIEVQWTHNGRFEWVTFDRVRVEAFGTTGRRRAVARATATKKALTSDRKNRKQTASSSPAKKSPKKPPKKVPTKLSEKLENVAEEVTEAESKEELKIADKRPIEDEVAPKEPPAKKRKINSVEEAGLFSTLSAQMVTAKDTVISGVMGLYNEYLGSSSSQNKGAVN